MFAWWSFTRFSAACKVAYLPKCSALYVCSALFFSVFVSVFIYFFSVLSECLLGPKCYRWLQTAAAAAVKRAQRLLLRLTIFNKILIKYFRFIESLAHAPYCVCFASIVLYGWNGYVCVSLSLSLSVRVYEWILKASFDFGSIARCAARTIPPSHRHKHDYTMVALLDLMQFRNDREKTEKVNEK